jgi:hypothetical protein
MDATLPMSIILAEDGSKSCIMDIIVIGDPSMDNGEARSVPQMGVDPMVSVFIDL